MFRASTFSSIPSHQTWLQLIYHQDYIDQPDITQILKKGIISNSEWKQLFFKVTD